MIVTDDFGGRRPAVRIYLLRTDTRRWLKGWRLQGRGTKTNTVVTGKIIFRETSVDKHQIFRTEGSERTWN